MSNSFIEACEKGDEKQARELYENDKSVLNKQDGAGYTGLTKAMFEQHHSICRWLLSLPDIDVNLTCTRRYIFKYSALHFAVMGHTPLDLVIALARLASKETIDLKWRYDESTALDLACQFHGSRAFSIYLSWLGAECKDENRKFTDVTLQTWLDEGRQQDAPMWAVAANDLNSLRHLDNVLEINLDKPMLLNIAALFGHHEIKCYLEDNQDLNIYFTQIYSDFEITFNERVFPCHKNFLANLSSPFQALFEEKRKKNLPMKTELENCPNETVVESFIKYFYIRGIDKDVLDWHIVSFLYLSDYYGVKELKTIVEDEMIAQLCKENVKESIIAADKYQGVRVKAAAFEFLRENRGIWAENVEEWEPYISRELLCQIVIKTG